MINTALIGGRDKPREDIKVFSEYSHFIKPVLNAKIYKVLAHLFVPGESIWVDANISTKVPEAEIFSELYFDRDLAMFRHPARTSALEEAKTLLSLKMGSASDVEDWIEHHPEGRGAGLFEANVIVRGTANESEGSMKFGGHSSADGLGATK